MISCRPIYMRKPRYEEKRDTNIKATRSTKREKKIKIKMVGPKTKRKRY